MHSSPMLARVQVEPLLSPCGICGARSVTGKSLCPRASVLLCIINTMIQYSPLIHLSSTVMA
jgi:hypothetical protein